MLMLLTIIVAHTTISYNKYMSVGMMWISLKFVLGGYKKNVELHIELGLKDEECLEHYNKLVS